MDSTIAYRKGKLVNSHKRRATNVSRPLSHVMPVKKRGILSPEKSTPDLSAFIAVENTLDRVLPVDFRIIELECALHDTIAVTFVTIHVVIRHEFII